MAEEKKYLDKAGLTHLVGKIKQSLSEKADKSEVQPKGNYATLGEDGKIISSQLPVYVDDIVEFHGMVNNVAIQQSTTVIWENIVYDISRNTFLAVNSESSITAPKYYISWTEKDNYKDGSDVPYKGKIYVDTESNKSYRWGGSTLVEVSKSLALGETAETAYSGAKGKALEEENTKIKQSLSEKADKSEVEESISSVNTNMEDTSKKTIKGINITSNASSVIITTSYLHDSIPDENIKIPNVSDINAGAMTPADKKKVDDLHTSESDRQAAEQSRAAAEQSRAKAETDRNEAERLRTDAEQKRAAAEQERSDTFRQQAETIDTALKNCETATEGAEKVNVVLSDANVLTVTDRDGQAKSVDLASQEDVAGIVDDVRHLNETMGAYTERESITLAAVEQNKAVSADGVKVSKSGWAIAEFTAEKGNVYLFKPGVTDGSVCIFAEKITSVETRGIDYTYTYNEDGTIATATATYLGKTHAYTYTWGTDAQGNKTATITENGAEVAALPMTYETQVGTYAPLVRLNADAELPKDGYCRYMSHFKGNSAIKIAVSYKVGSADLVMKVTRDGVLASISTQLGNLSQKEDETRSKVEEYHRSYIDLLFKEDWTVYVDGVAVKIPGGKKTKVYPIREFKMGNLYANIPFLWMDVSHLDVSTFNSLYCLFNDCETLRRLDLSGWNVSNVENMFATFFKCKELEYLDLSGWQTEKLMNLQNTFYICNAHLVGLENWDVSNVTNMAYIFAQAGNTAPLDLSGWNTAGCTDMTYAFRSCQASSIDLSSWDMSANPKVAGMFQFCNPKSLVLGPRFFTMSYSNFDLSMANWTDATVKQSLVVSSYDRRANGLDDLTLTLHANTKKVLTEDDIATMTAKGYIIA